MGQRNAPGGERWRAAPGGKRRERKARGDERWPAATDQLTVRFVRRSFLNPVLRRAIALGAYKLDFNAAPGAL
eukprot:4823443-Pleurochrysis_carterae.AAC.4